MLRKMVSFKGGGTGARAEGGWVVVEGRGMEDSGWSMVMVVEFEECGGGGGI